MKIHLMTTDSIPFPSNWESFLTNEFPLEKVTSPDEHEAISAMFGDKESGIVLVPAIWDDLRCVKITQELKSLATPFQVVFYGTTPVPNNLCLAYNEGVSSFIDVEANLDHLRHAIKRALQKCETELDYIQRWETLKQREALLEKDESKTEREARDQAVANALLDVINQQGPLFENSVQLLIVSSSEAQLKKLKTFLQQVKINIKATSTIQDALRSIQASPPSVILSDSVLPDGLVTDFAKRLREISLEKVPGLIVWTSSPEKVHELSAPEHFIDYVVLKPSLDAGMETILLDILSIIYRQKGEGE